MCHYSAVYIYCQAHFNGNSIDYVNFQQNVYTKLNSVNLTSNIYFALC